MPFDLKKSLPKPGTRFALPTLYGSSDAYALAVAALELKAGKQMLAVVVANASDGQRLLDEIPWFADGKLACHLLPDWETLPYDAFSPHQDLVSERLATLHEIQQRPVRRADRAGHHRAGAPGAAVVPGRPTPSSSSRAKSSTRRASRRS